MTSFAQSIYWGDAWHIIVGAFSFFFFSCPRRRSSLGKRPPTRARHWLGERLMLLLLSGGHVMYYNLTRLSSNHCASELLTPKSYMSKLVSSGEQLKSKCELELREVKLWLEAAGVGVRWGGMGWLGVEVYLDCPPLFPADVDAQVDCELEDVVFAGCWSPSRSPLMQVTW